MPQAFLTLKPLGHTILFVFDGASLDARPCEKIACYLLFKNLLVALVGVEPTWVAPHDFESCMYTSSITEPLVSF